MTAVQSSTSPMNFSIDSSSKMPTDLYQTESGKNLINNPRTPDLDGDVSIAENQNIREPGGGGNVQEAIEVAEEAAGKRRMESVMFSNAMQQIAQDTEHMRKGLEQSGKAIFAETRTG